MLSPPSPGMLLQGLLVLVRHMLLLLLAQVW
jgi:hypothetical protein